MHFICYTTGETPLSISETDKARLSELTRENVLVQTIMAANRRSLFLVLKCDDAFAANEIIKTLDCLNNRSIQIEELLWDKS